MASSIFHSDFQDFVTALSDLGKDNYTKARHEAGLYTEEEVQKLVDYFLDDLKNFAIEKNKEALQNLTDGFVRKGVQVINYLLHKDVDLQTIEEVKRILIG